jgi:putative endonuclease
VQHSRSYFVYIVTSKPRGTLYIGVTNNLHRRMIEHRERRASSFTQRYKVFLLMWFEQHSNIHAAIQREKSLKLYPRDWKMNLIERDNPTWEDLFPALEATHGVPPGPDSLNPGSSGQARG